MSLPEFFFDRVTADIRQQMEGVLALTDQLGRQRLTPDAQACVSGVAEAATGVRRMLQVFGGLVAGGIAGMRRGAVEASLRAVTEADTVRVTGRVRGARDAAW